jgi:lysophospholipase
MLPPRFEEPAGFHWGHFRDRGGVNIRYGWVSPYDGVVHGTVVILPGFREPVEKLFELTRDLLEQGFAVWLLDRQGQGGSDRVIKDHPQKMGGVDYTNHIHALHHFVTGIVKHAGPLLLFGHSMGGHIALRYLKEHGVFNAAVLTSPMVDIQTPPFPRIIALMLVAGARLLGLLDWYVPGGQGALLTDKVFPGNLRTSDPQRFAVQAEIFSKKPELKMNGPTFGWVAEALRSIKILNDESYLRAIKTPILMGIAGNDKIVDVEAEKRAASLMPNCEEVEIPEARHEIWMERDVLRQPWMIKVSSFLATHLQTKS